MSKPSDQTKRGRPLTPWELPKLLEPMHRWKPTKKRNGCIRWRPHFLPILAFVYRNRFAVASQIQRRFAEALPSDRTARRHLAELEATECLSVAHTRSTSPLFPKVYYVTGRGVRNIEKSLRERGIPGRCCRRDRRRADAYTPEHVLHEILTTEFLMDVWESCRIRDDLELLSVQRRALERHSAFAIDGRGRHARLKPDAMFLYRQGKGMMCCFLEMDNGTMNPRQMQSKFGRYGTWARSSRAIEFLLTLYRQHGAGNPQPTFRILVVTRHRSTGTDQRRLKGLLKLAGTLHPQLGHRMRFATVADFASARSHALPICDSSWYRLE